MKAPLQSSPRGKGKPQIITRIPPYRPGQWIKLRQVPPGTRSADLSGQVRCIRSLTCSITSPKQKFAIWRIHFEDGRCVDWHLAERLATEAEIAAARRKGLR
jgi:hypothetical protein